MVIFVKKLFKKIFYLFSFSLLFLSLSSCFNPINSLKEYNVTFNLNDDEKNIKTVTVSGGKTVSLIEDPLKENYRFVGWYTDSSFINKYDFSNSVNSDLSLYAKYELDAVSITNKISTDLIKGVVKIYNRCYNTNFFGVEKDYMLGQGSGFCFYEDNDNYYFLTNCHVAVKNKNFDKQKYSIEDYQGNSYDAYLYKNPQTNISAISADYDLACMYIKASSTNIKSLSMTNKNPSKDDDVISIGSPKGQSNTITYGKVLKYDYVSLSGAEEYESNVKFKSLYHNAYINHGSSGGPLLNSKLKVCGVNFAGSEEGTYSASIPISNVNEFLNKFVYEQK